MCKYRILKILIIISNIINLTFGMTLILVGSYVHLFLSTYIVDIHMHILSLTFAMIALGCLLFSIGSIGVVNVWTGRRAIIIIYIGLLTVYVISGILIVIFTLTIRNKGCAAQLDGHIQQCLLFIMACIVICTPIEIASAITTVLLSIKRKTISWKEQISFC
ncbi:unnamed protein product [Trichobilharzia szidati]|nr:unnamed protein product [Trichobilharzia szidati]